MPGTVEPHRDATTTNAIAPAALQHLISHEEITRLRTFHASHFEGRPIPDVRAHDPQPTESNEGIAPTEEVLGYYEDGVRRTLTEDQIKMFRHSEIQRLLLERQQKREAAEKEAERRERRRLREATQQQRHFDEPDQDTVNVLDYDDAQEPPAKKQDRDEAKEKKFLWPQLRK